MQFLTGKKTYIIAGLVGLISVAGSLGWIDKATEQQLRGFLEALALATIRIAVAKAEVPPPGEPHG